MQQPSQDFTKLSSEEVLDKVDMLDKILNAVMENTFSGIIVTNSAGKFIYWNQLASRIFGQGPLDVPIEEWATTYQIYLPDGMTPYPVNQLPLIKALRGETVRDTFLCIRISETPVWIECNAAPLSLFIDKERNERLAVLIFTDVTDKRKREQDLINSNSEYEQFAYIASHDLQEPLRTISSYTLLIAKRCKGKVDQDTDEFVDYVLDATKRMQNLIEDLLEYSRIDQKGRDFISVDANKVLKVAIDSVKVSLTENKARITSDLLPVVIADYGQLIQMFQNLLSNAIKFRNGEDPEIHVAAERKGDFWEFSVKDNGIGIEERYFERIFVIFQRLHGRSKYPGTGIGLALCKRIVERHGGRIWISSQVGEGSTFYFTLRPGDSHNVTDSYSNTIRDSDGGGQSE